MPLLRKLDDQAVLDVGAARIAFTTDSFVVTPLFFPGGNIGELAVNGTVNDLAMSGATPLYLSAAFILEEDCRWRSSRAIVQSMSAAAAAAGVAIVTGDTKVVNRGSADKLFVTTTGSRARAGRRRHLRVERAAGRRHPAQRHHRAITAWRCSRSAKGWSSKARFSPIRSRCTAWSRRCCAAGEIHVLRDPTRGGLGTSLCEIARRSNIGVEIDARAVPVREPVKGACELLGIDPLFVANEGKLVAFVAPDRAEPCSTPCARRRRAASRRSSAGQSEQHPGMVAAEDRDRRHARARPCLLTSNCRVSVEPSTFRSAIR